MKKIVRLYIISLTMLSFLSPLSQAALQAPSSPQRVTTQFYNWRIQQAFSGLPDKATLKLASTYLSPQLVCLLNQAHRYQTLFIEHFPTDKPPFIEGDMFSSLFEGPHRYEITTIKHHAKTVRLTLHFFYDRTHQRDTKGWKDTVILKQYKERWLIDDIAYDGHFAFGHTGTLQKNLLAVLGQDDATIHWQAKTLLEACPAHI